MPRPVKLVAYPPASIWKTKEEGAKFEFRGNVFARKANQVTYLPTATIEPATALKATPTEE